MGRAGREQLEQQYTSLLVEYGEALARLAASYESLPHAREDLLQEIRLAVWTALPGFRGECSMRTFLYRIAHNRGLTHVWRRRTRPSQSEDPPETADPAADPETSAIRNSDQTRLMKAVRSLPVLYRQVITLALEDLPQSEIAAVLGISENNVAVRLNRARKMLREKLEGKP